MPLIGAVQSGCDLSSHADGNGALTSTPGSFTAAVTSRLARLCHSGLCSSMGERGSLVASFEMQRWRRSCSDRCGALKRGSGSGLNCSLK